MDGWVAFAAYAGLLLNVISIGLEVVIEKKRRARVAWAAEMQMRKVVEDEDVWNSGEGSSGMNM